MRAFVLILALAFAAGPARAQDAARAMEEACTRGPGRGVRLEDAPGARAEAACAVAPDGRLETCAVLSAEPDTPSVRYFALQQLCFVTAAAPAPDAPWTHFALSFDVQCARERGAQMCSVVGARVSQIGQEAQASPFGAPLAAPSPSSQQPAIEEAPLEPLEPQPGRAPQRDMRFSNRP